MVRHIVYHYDLDGECAAAIAYKFYTQKGEKSINLIKMHYDKGFPMSDIKPEDSVDILDFSLQKNNEFKKLLSITNKVIWIDHHKTAIDSFRALELDGIQSTEKSGCELAWDYYIKSPSAPPIVKYIGDFDTWKFNFNPNTELAVEALKTYDTSPTSEMWRKWFRHEIPLELLKEGKSCINYRNNTNEQLASTTFTFTWNGYKCIACNCQFTGSKVFDSISKIEEFDLMITFGFNGKLWNVSLYSEKENVFCGDIAKRYGGGGHKGAAGFQINELPKEFRQE